VSVKPAGTYWAAEVVSVNRLDGRRSHLAHEGLVPRLFPTRAECRAFIDARYGYIRDRPDLQREPHGWRVPRAILVRVE
jgi:hypothetical protein